MGSSNSVEICFTILYNFKVRNKFYQIERNFVHEGRDTSSTSRRRQKCRVFGRVRHHVGNLNGGRNNEKSLMSNSRNSFKMQSYCQSDDSYKSQLSYHNGSLEDYKMLTIFNTNNLIGIACVKN